MSKYKSEDKSVNKNNYEIYKIGVGKCNKV